MDITTYTTYQEVRSACGLSAMELTDTELAEELYANSLYLRLSEVTLPDEEPGPGPLDTRFVTVAAIAEVSRTVAQQKLYSLTRMFSTYAVALDACVSLSMKVPKTVTDSKASLTRFSPEATFRDVISRLEKLMESAKNSLETINETSVTSLPYMTTIPPAKDTITNS